MIGGRRVRLIAVVALVIAVFAALTALAHVRVVGGIRPQNYDVGYRPDGVRFVHDTAGELSIR